MPVIIPTSADLPHFTVSVDLDDTTFGLEFRWNERAGGWFFSVAAADGTPLLSGKRLVLGWPLLAHYADPRLPAGEFIAEDTSGASLEAALGDLGTRVLLLYYSADELSGRAG